MTASQATETVEPDPSGEHPPVLSPVLSVDAMGGDGGPAPVVAGLARLACGRPALRVLLYGDEAALAPLVARHRLEDHVEVRPAASVVPMDARPSEALRTHRDSSLWMALRAVAEGEAGVAVSAGNTGALLAMAVLCLRKAPGVLRPAIAVQWPATRAEGFNTVLDVGADFRVEAHQLAQHAVMGAEYARLALGHDRPRVGLLNLGAEPGKGPPVLREAAALIEKAAGSGRFDYVGFVEGADIPGDRVEVVVTDGFTGNVALKTAEGTAMGEAFNATWASRLAGMLARPALRRLSRRIDPRRVNGGVFLGLGGGVVKAHGGSDAVGFDAALGLAVRLAETGLPVRIAAELARLGQDVSAEAAAEPSDETSPLPTALPSAQPGA